MFLFIDKKSFNCKIMDDNKVNADNNQSVSDPLVDDLRKQLIMVVDVKHLNVSNILGALTKGMQIVKDIRTKTNEQKKILLLKAMSLLINESELSQNNKEDLIWVVDEMGPAAIELFLVVAVKGIKPFKNMNCLSCIKC